MIRQFFDTMIAASIDNEWWHVKIYVLESAGKFFLSHLKRISFELENSFFRDESIWFKKLHVQLKKICLKLKETLLLWIKKYICFEKFHLQLKRFYACLKVTLFGLKKDIFMNDSSWAKKIHVKLKRSLWIYVFIWKFFIYSLKGSILQF